MLGIGNDGEIRLISMCSNGMGYGQGFGFGCRHVSVTSRSKDAATGVQGD